jgi:FtsP/CotA-like multicopper oxidase with cupredoxin domain
MKTCENNFSRRQVMKTGLAATTGLMIPWRLSRLQASPVPTPAISGLSDPAFQPKFEEVVPNALDPGFIFDTSSGRIRIGVDQSVHETGLIDEMGNRLTTTVWGYGADGIHTWPGRTIQVWSHEPLEVEWQNRLGGLPYLITGLNGRPVLDTSLHWAYSLKGYEQYRVGVNGVPIVPHVHGGHSDSIYDGNPEYFFSPGYNIVGPRWVSQKYRYKNDQPAGTVWYHDHALGITRLNVYSGMAGFYIIRDEFDTGLVGNPLDLPAFPYEAAFAIQDRMFKANGELFYPAFPGDPFYEDFIIGEDAMLPPDIFPGGGPTALAEFFGDHMLVNGKIWPKMEVEPRNYRLRFLNGCDSRFLAVQFYEVPAGDTDFRNSIAGPLNFTVIGSDQGLASSPTTVDTLLMETGSRYDIIFDFKQVTPGNRVIMRNIGGDEPFGGEIEGLRLFDETDRIMAFDLVLPLNSDVADSSPSGINFGPNVPPPTRFRKVALFEGKDEFGRLQPLLGTAEPATNYRGEPVNWPDKQVYRDAGLTGQMQGSIAWHTPTTENPALGSTEVWDIYNATGDAHPIHLHLVNFEILGRRTFTADVMDQSVVQHNGETGMGFRLENITVSSSPVILSSEYVENAPKDMVTALPGQVTRIKMTFDKPGRYVWHCHLLSHEDHEMMRVMHVGPGARGFLDFAAYGLNGELKLEDDAWVRDNVGAAEKIELKKGSKVEGTVISTGDEVKLKNDTVVDEDVVAYDRISLEGNASVSGMTYPYTAATPPLPVNFTVVPGSQNFKVKKWESRELEPGVYKKLKVEESAVLTLFSGEYVFEEFLLEKDSTVNLVGGPIVIKVEKKVEMKDRVRMELLDGTEAKDVLFLVSDSVMLGKRGNYLGSFLAPYGDVELGEDAFLTGALYGKDVSIKKRAELTREPACDLIANLFAV